jgi:hypothetical protein
LLDNECWFCLSNVKVETHLIISVINETYLTVAKGALVPGHLILVPVAHYSCSRQLELLIGEKAILAKTIVTEIEKVTQQVCKVLKNQVMISYEIFRGSDPSERECISHMHIQVF